MAKYHISKSGKPALCKAILRECPLGTHYNTKEDAHEAYQTKMSKEYGVLSSVDPDGKKDELKKQYKNQYDLVRTTRFKSREEEEAARTKLANLAKRIKGKESEVALIRESLQGHKTAGGGSVLSMSQHNSTQRAIVPLTGFCANLYPELSVTFNSSKEINHNKILAFMDNIEKEKEGLLSEKDVYIGIWNDPKTGKVRLDVSKRFSVARDARRACEKGDSKTYFDLQVFESVKIRSK